MKSETLFTWLDVEFLLESLKADAGLPIWLYRYTVYQDDLVLEISEGTPEKDVSQFLQSTFRARYLDGSRIALESTPDKQRFLTVLVEKADSGEIQRRTELAFTPSFRRVAALPDGGGQIIRPKPLPSEGPEIVAFYSFKGGVGRTTHLLAYLQALSERKADRRALIIDADLEAPGISSLISRETSLPEAGFSFIDLLALVQSDESEGSNDSLDLAAYMTTRQVLSANSRDSSVEHYFIPAFRSDEQAMRLDIRPEHISARPGRAWFLSEFLSNLGRRLGVDVVLIDLRAGLSELSSPFLFDPRIRRVVVSTPSAQSIDGTCSVLKQLGKVSLASGWATALDPIVVLSFVLPELLNSTFLEETNTRILQAYPALDPQDEVPNLQILVTPFLTELLYFSSITEAMTRLEPSVLARRMNELVEQDLPSKQTDLPSNLNLLDGIRERLSSIAEKLEYAESGKGDEFLRIAPLRALARQYSSTPPVAVVIGAKGSGKTYTYLQVLRAGGWSNFVEKVNGDKNAKAATLWPVLHSQNLTPLAQEIVDQARKTAQKVVDTKAAMNLSTLSDEVKIALRTKDADEVWWRHKWFEIFSKSLGIAPTAANSYASVLIDTLRKTNQQIVLMVDGLEDLFPDLAASTSEQIALRALIQGVPTYLREVPDNPLGVLIFVRADLARAAVPQNYGQFSRLYDAFALQWNEEEALRLAVWLALSAGMPRPAGIQKEPELFSIEEAKEALIALWGPKLGTEKSREARSAEWVIAALSDFRGQIQARDLVRFLRFAALDSIGGLNQDRILTPSAVRNAIRPCGESKIDESVQEIPQLKAIFAKLRNVEDLRIPFDATRANLTSEDIRFLQSVGMVAELNGEYYMPEIYRFGLGLRLSEGARPKVLSLARRFAFAT